MALTNLNSIVKSGLFKNYISLGDFETGLTTGWSLLHTTLTSNIPTGIGSAGAPFSLTNGATAASANLSFSATTVNPLAGSASGSLVSSAASTAGDMLISQAYSIDQEDQNKVLTFRFFYEQMSGTTLSFAGNSTNTFAIYIYDVDNGVWIQPAGVYNLIQGSGSGYATGTFQTASNSTRFQIALININASAGAFNLYVDDFYVGQQASVQGVPPLDRVLATMSSGVTTVTVAGVDNLVLLTTISSSPRTNYSLTANGVTIFIPGTYRIRLGVNVLCNSETNMLLKLDVNGTKTSGLAHTASNTGASNICFLEDTFIVTLNAGDVVKMFVNIPTNARSYHAGELHIEQLTSASVAFSSDTDTRVVSFSASTATAAASTTVPVVYTNVVNDSHGGYSSTTGRYTVQVSGVYRVTAQILAVGPSLGVRKNGTLLYIGFASGSTNGAGIVVDVPCIVGDILDVVPSTNTTPSASATANFFMISRMSGPAVIAATESVNARAFASATTITSSLATIVWTTKDFDSHGALSGGVYTAPVSGRYQFNVKLAFTAASAAAGNSVDVQVQKNGVAISEESPVYQSTQVLLPVQVSDEVFLNAGDTLQVQASSAATTPSILSSNTKNVFSIARVGN